MAGTLSAPATSRIAAEVRSYELQKDADIKSEFHDNMLSSSNRQHHFLSQCWILQLFYRIYFLKSPIVLNYWFSDHSTLKLRIFLDCTTQKRVQFFLPVTSVTSVLCLFYLMLTFDVNRLCWKIVPSVIKQDNKISRRCGWR